DSSPRMFMVDEYRMTISTSSRLLQLRMAPAGIVQVAQPAGTTRAVNTGRRIVRNERVSLRPCQMSLLVVQGVGTAHRFRNIRHPHVALRWDWQIGEHDLRFLPAFDFHAGSKHRLLAGNRLVSDGVPFRAGILDSKHEGIPQGVCAAANPNGDIC